MDKKLRMILEEFSSKLHEYEEAGGDLPDEVDDIWAEITDVLMKE
jgi:hypothetical protein